MRATPVLLGLGLVLVTGCFKADGGLEDEAAGTDTDTTESGESGDTTTTTSTSTSTTDTTTTSSSSSSDTTDGGCVGDLPAGGACTTDCECASSNCYVVPFLGGQCGECNEDADCPAGGCTSPNPFEANGSTCNMGELGGGCESSDVCADGLTCGNVLDLLGLIQINTCGNCQTDADCMGQICAPVVSVSEFSGINDCIDVNSLPQDSFCNLEGNGNDACASGLCSTIDIMGLAQVGACGECNTDADCMGTTCIVGEFLLDTGTLVGSTCQ